MKIEGIDIEGKVVDLTVLKHILGDLGLVLAGQWDYERVTFDYKFENHKEGVYYLRLQGHAVEGEVDTPHARIKLLTPLLGKYYYPHGVEYGEGEKFPKAILDKSKQLLETAKKQIEEAQKDA